MIDIALKNIEKYYGGSKILEGISFEIHQGDKVGILGRNGAGKTTIFKIIARLEGFHKGDLSIRKGATIGYLNQINDCPKNYKVKDILNSAFKELQDIRNKMSALEKEMTKTENNDLDNIMKKYGELQLQYESQGGYQIEEKIGKICTGLKMNEEFTNRLFDSLSGGEKTIVMLGKVLLQDPDILLLDEPTNHLDIESVEWLEAYLKDYKGTVLIISHDRYFLENVVTKIFYIEKGKADIYLGNYSYFIEEKERRLQEQLADYNNQQKKINEMEQAIKRFREWGTRGDNEKMFKKAANMEKRIAKMDKVEKPILEKRKIKLTFSNTSRSGKDVIKITGLTKKFDNNLLLKNLDLHVKYGEKIAILGRNGCGKSTLIKIILDEMNADKGEVIIGSGVKIGYLQQDIEFNNEWQTVLEAFKESHPMSDGAARHILAKFLFYADDVFKKVKNLSGGERVRLKLCQLMYTDINLFIMDEPTNHLDIESREMLEKALEEFEGTILFISHDRYFINKIAKRIGEIRDKKIINYVGNYDYFKEKKALECVENNKKTNRKDKISKENTKEKKIISVNHREEEIKKLEKEIEKLEKELEHKNIEIKKYASEYDKLSEIYMEKMKLENELEGLLQTWVQLNS